MGALTPQQKERQRAARSRASRARRGWPSVLAFDFGGKLAKAKAAGDHLALGYATFEEYVEKELIEQIPAESQATARRLLAPPSPPSPSVVRGVYFIQSVHGGPIKIGVAGHVPSRFASIQCMSPCRLRLLGVERGGDRRRERELHDKFAGIRLHGEWFEPTPALLAYIAEHAEVPR